MLFNSLLFLFVLLPIVLFLHSITKGTWRNYILLAGSLVFFAWGGVSYSLLLIVSILFNYLFGRLIDNAKTKKAEKWHLGLGIAINLSLISTFKYASFFIANINSLFSCIGIQEIKDPGIILPIGISFYTFQAISYLIDVYRKTTKVQKNIGNLALYIASFPQLIAGPIVRYHDIAKQINDRKLTYNIFAQGVERFMIGLAKKVLIANNLALVADTVFAVPAGELSTLAAWIGILAYSLQIYTDFSGYSDMAIGLGKMFGFTYLENFNFPYISRSIKEFWRRWHMSLSYWFRDYLYISLGGNRKGKTRTYINLMIVFVLTGFWHGASWAFVVWGLYHGFFLILERSGFDKILNKTWRPIQHFYAVFIAIMGWVLFRAETFEYAAGFYKALFTYKPFIINNDLSLVLFSNEFIITSIVAVLGAAYGFYGINNILNNYFCTIYNKEWIKHSFNFIYTIFFSVIFLLSITYIISGSYNPFIYFRF